MFTKPLKFLPNLRTEKADATTGYTWGKPVSDSNILSKLSPQQLSILKINPTDIVAERWMVTDDRQFSSQVVLDTGDTVDFYSLLEKYPEELLGSEHVRVFGPYLNVIMKQLDTNSTPTKGSLSVQLHPKVGHPTRPPKPEMWKGRGKTYLGWNQEMSEEDIRTAVESGTLEQYMNAIEMNPDKLIVVSGGLIHAIRYGTFTAEWSKAPGRDDIAKGNIKAATVSPYDRTDGKTPRPGKEDIDSSLEVMRHANTFSRKTEKELLTKKVVIQKDDVGNIQWQLFRTPEVFVDEYTVESEVTVDLSKRGLSFYMEQGNAFILSEGEVIDEVSVGEERFLPCSLGAVNIQRRGVEPVVLQTWYAPFDREL